MAVGPMLIGLTLGIYGLFQALLQVPYGYLSDRFWPQANANCGSQHFYCRKFGCGAWQNELNGCWLVERYKAQARLLACFWRCSRTACALNIGPRAMAMVGGSIGLAFGGSPRAGTTSLCLWRPASAILSRRLNGDFGAATGLLGVAWREQFNG